MRAHAHGIRVHPIFMRMHAVSLRMHAWSMHTHTGLETQTPENIEHIIKIENSTTYQDFNMKINKKDIKVIIHKKKTNK